MCSQEHRDFGFADPARSHSNRQVVKTSLGSLNLQPVNLQEGQRRNQTRPLVAIDECMVLDDVEEISRRHLEQVDVQELPPEGCSGLGDCRFKEAHVPDTMLTTVQLDLVAVQQQNVSDLEEIRFHVLFRQTTQVVAVFAIDLVQGLV